MFWTGPERPSILPAVEDYRAQVGARLRNLRKSRSLSQENAAHLVGVTSTTWGRWERGKVAPYDHNWQRIEEAFEVDVAHIRGIPPDPLAVDSHLHEELFARFDSLEQRLEQRLWRMEQRLEAGPTKAELDAARRLISQLAEAPPASESPAKRTRRRAPRARPS